MGSPTPAPTLKPKSHPPRDPTIDQSGTFLTRSTRIGMTPLPSYSVISTFRLYMPGPAVM